MNRREMLKGMAAVSLALPRAVSSTAPDSQIQPATHATPTLREFERLQFGVSFHFSMNTFTGDDYDVGAAPTTTYNPTHLDVRQWIRLARDLGARYRVLTAKHMSGFCLWDSEGYDYDVTASGNKTDVVAAFVAACREYDLRPGFYYCILDPHNEGKFDWDSPVPDSYYALIKHHLTELHGRHPNTFYQLLDITRKISQEQRWELYRLIKKFSPRCMVVMNQGYDQSRRKLGRICEPKSWPTDVINAEDTLPPPEGHDPHIEFEGKRYYLPMESWIPTGPPYKPLPPMHSWFWREGFTTQSADVIASGYSDCRKRYANLLLNLSPDKTGVLPEEAVQKRKEAARLIKNSARS
jgi:alpha-L-fucosidase